MSRWGKNRGTQSYALPLDALVKEKENTNRPIAARSAGTVGKWGVTSFTSIRARPIYGYASFSPNQPDQMGYSQFSPMSLIESSQIGSTAQSPNNNTAPKPKKFFKSRNTEPDPNLLAALSDPQVVASMTSPSYYGNVGLPYQAQPMQFYHSEPAVAEPKASGKRKGKSDDASKKAKVERVPKAPKPPKPPKVAKVKIEKPPKPEKVPKPVSKKKAKAAEKAVDAPKPTRILSRARKVVNYSEERSRSPPASAKRATTALHANDAQTENNELHGLADNAYEANAQNDLNAVAFDGQSPNDSGELPSKNQAGPPIVLRISKGTSRLISTDSEGISGSPPYLSPAQPTAANAQTQNNSNYPSAAASLVAVLTGEPQPQQDQQSIGSPATNDLTATTKTKKAKAKHKAEPIKLKLKTTARLREHTADFANQLENQYDSYGNQSTAAQQYDTEQNLDGDRIPQPGTANYDLYRTLTDSPPNPYQTQPTIHVTEPQQYSQHSEPTAHQSIAEHNQYGGDVNHSDSPIDDLPERGILPKKRRGRNKAKFDTIAEQSVTEEISSKKSRNRKKTDEHQPESLINQPQIDIAQAPVNLEYEPIPKQRITAAAKKQYKESGEAAYTANEEPVDMLSHATDNVISEPATQTRGRGRKPKVPKDTAPDEISTQRVTRTTRNNTNGAMNQEKVPIAEVPPVSRSYGRKRKAATEENSNVSPVEAITPPTTDTSSRLAENGEQNLQTNAINQMLPPVNDSESDDAKNVRGRLKRQCSISLANGTNESQTAYNNNANAAPTAAYEAPETNTTESDKPSVKLLISKKKGSIFKSRAIESESGESKNKKRHVYKHVYKWDVDESFEEKPNATGATATDLETSYYGDFDINVKRAHQMQEIGEFQEMDDDVEYILESLKSQNPIATRSLAAIQLASKCMIPAFRMHVRAHGTATKFFAALCDATQNQSLGLCTATIMFVLIQDNLNMDLDKHSLGLMLNLLESDISGKNNFRESGMTDEQSHRNEQKVLEICREIKSQGKAEHLNLEQISTGTLAMETLLTLTSKRAGEWFKDEMRKLGGIEHIINTVCDCCNQISDYVVEWTEPLLAKLRKIQRCLQVLENLTNRSEDNQKYILNLNNGQVVDTLVRFYKLCYNGLVQYPTNDSTPSSFVGCVLREALVPMLQVLCNLTHTFNNRPFGAVIFGKRTNIFDVSLHLLFQSPQYIPEKCVFEQSLLVLMLLINLTAHSLENQKALMSATAQYEIGTMPAIKALIEYFYKYEELARFVEQNTDDILDKPEKRENNKYKSKEEVEETVSKLMQKAGTHMEHTFLASYVCLLVGHLILDNRHHEEQIRVHIRNRSFELMVQVLDKYYNFMNLTASSEAVQVAHMKETKRIIQCMKDCDVHPNDGDRKNAASDLDEMDFEPYQTRPEIATYARSHNTYSSQSRATTSADDRWASGSSTSASSSNNSNNLFNKVYHSGR